MIPSEFKSIARVEFTCSDTKALINYLHAEESKLRESFAPDISFTGFSYDSQRHIYRYRSGTCYPGTKIRKYRIEFIPTDVVKTIFGTRGVGDLKLTLTTTLPNITYTSFLARRISTRGYYNADGVFVFGFPDKAVKLRNVLDGCIANNSKAVKNASEDIRVESNHTSQTCSDNSFKKESAPSSAEGLSKELKAALNLFMFDSLNNISTSELHSQRNRLIKAFHPDGDIDTTIYAQKINEAYQILKSYIEKNS